MKFKDNLRKLRKENNLSQEKLAEKLNISRQAISKWESGKAYPDIDNLILLRDIFNVSLDELVVNERIDKEEIISEENYIDSDNKCSYEEEENEEDDDDDITNFMFIGFMIGTGVGLITENFILGTAGSFIGMGIGYILNFIRSK